MTALHPQCGVPRVVCGSNGRRGNAKVPPKFLGRQVDNALRCGPPPGVAEIGGGVSDLLSAAGDGQGPKSQPACGGITFAVARVSPLLSSTLAHGRAALARCFDVDRRVSDDGQRRDRYVCQVSVGSIDVNLAMLDAGLAMAARQNSRYVRNPASHAREDAARIARRGLWQQPSPVPPWIWRRVCWEQLLCASA